MRLSNPRTINPARVFNSLVDWFHTNLIIHRKAPGFIIGLSGTDSLVAFCAAAKALEKAGKSDRLLGVHFAPSEDFLEDHPEAATHLWFRDQILPWLKEKFPNAKVIVDTSIDWRYDGQRWGMLMDLSVVSNDKRRMMRLPEEQYWLVGTRNRSEDVLLNYSNASTMASIQPLIHFWKSEILQLAEYLGIPQIALNKSCETDCICGRLALVANHIREVDMLLMARCGELSRQSVEELIPTELQKQLDKFIEHQITNSNFKKHIPYSPSKSIMEYATHDPLVQDFQTGSLNLKEFNHYKHLYVAWSYLKDMPFEEAVSCYSYFLSLLLEEAGQSHRFNEEITRKYFERLASAMKLHPTSSFEELVEKHPDILSKISA